MSDGQASDGEGRTPMDGAALAREWRELRQAALELVAKLPETRAYRRTDRPGWTLKHELSHLASLDEELMHLLAGARGGLAEHLAPALRRRRGQAMHAAQEMRLARLRDHLEVAGDATAEALAEAADVLHASVRIAEDEARTVGDLVRERLERARTSVEVLRKHLG